MTYFSRLPFLEKRFYSYSIHKTTIAEKVTTDTDKAIGSIMVAQNDRNQCCGGNYANSVYSGVIQRNSCLPEPTHW